MAEYNSDTAEYNLDMAEYDLDTAEYDLDMAKMRNLWNLNLGNLSNLDKKSSKLK